MSAYSKGSPIQKWGDLAWVVEHDSHIWLMDHAMPMTVFREMTYAGIERLLIEGKLFVAVDPAGNASMAKAEVRFWQDSGPSGKR